MTRTRGLSLAAIITLLLLPLALEARIDPRCESFEVRLKDAEGAVKVKVYELATNSVETRQTTVKVPA